jgi:hypothetical protein
MEMTDQLHNSDAFLPGKEPSTSIRLKATWAGPRLGLHMVVKRKFVISPGRAMIL